MKRKMLMLTLILALIFSWQKMIRGGDEPDSLKEREVHEAIIIKGYDGQELAIGSKAPYSPRQTCGGECHDYDEITKGYHFQQGRADGSGKIIISDNFNPKKPWHKSKGMFGKW